MKAGQARDRAVQNKRDVDRIYDDDGRPAGRHALPEGRDWE